MNGSRLLLTVLIVVGLVLSGCRRGQSTGNRPTPTITPTPLSTPLPAIATNVPTGTETNPLRIIFLRSDRTGFADALLRFEEAMEAPGVLNVAPIPVGSAAELFQAMCAEENADAVNVVWVDGVTYAAARARNCGVAVLQLQRGGLEALSATVEPTGEATPEATPTRSRGGDAQAEAPVDQTATGSSIAIISPRRNGISSMAGLDGRTFCRLNYSDFTTWLAPSLMMRASDIDPVTDLEAVIDYPNLVALVTAVVEDECDAAAIPADLFQTMATELGELEEDVRVVETSDPFPFGILMLPVDVPLGVRIPLIDTLLQISSDPATNEVVRTVLGEDLIIPIEPGDLDEFDEFLDSTGLDFALLGR